MILSTNFLKDYIDLDDDLDIHQLAEDMTKMGNEYDTEGKLINATKLVIGEIMDCVEHPDSDHLHVCQVKVGEGDVRQIVCGAPNARKGLKVIVALDGAKLPEIEIKKGVIRGQESNGMMCALYELGLDKKYLTDAQVAGIEELPADAPVGEDPIKYLGLDDGVIDFDLTANRGDLLSILGMAYEVGAIYDKKVKDIDLTHAESDEELKFKVDVKTENCSLFLAREVKNVKIAESPDYIKERLIASGIRPINNVVDISNYVMIETGQPLHFYDADKLNGMLQVRMAEEGEKLTTLDEQERELSAQDIVISDGTRAIGLAGVMGGLDTEITENTKNVVIEAAVFDGVCVRKTSNKILRSEASNRFEKGLDPNRTYMAMERAVKLLSEIAEGEVLKGTEVYDKADKENKKIEITVENINNILGTKLSKDEIIDCFRRLAFECESKDNTIIVDVPTRRIDISIKEDLIEEVGRVYGVDNVEGKSMTLSVKKGSYDRTSREIRNKMVNLGLSETLSYVLTNPEEAPMFTSEKLDGNKESIRILKPLTEERSCLRQTVTTALYRLYQYNKAHHIEDINIFEIGKSFYKLGEEFFEEKKLSALMSGTYYTGLKQEKIDFYTIKGVVEEVLEYLGYGARYSFVVDDNIPGDLHPGKSASIIVDGKYMGYIGRINPCICNEEVYVFEINLDKLLAVKTGKMKYKEISKFPTVKKDIALLVNKDVPASDLQKAIKSAGGKLLLNSKVFDLYTGKGIDEDKKSIAFTLEIGDSTKTLTDEEIAEEINKITENLAKKFNAELRG